MWMHTGCRPSLERRVYCPLAATQVEAASAEGYLVTTPTQVEAACLEGFDGMSFLVTKVLGAEAWLRMVSHSKYSHGKYSHSKYSYGKCSHGKYSHGKYSHGKNSHSTFSHGKYSIGAEAWLRLVSNAWHVP